MTDPRPAEPRLERALTLQMQGDWGSANLHRVCGWVSQELVDRSGAGSRVAIWSGRGFVDAMHAVGTGLVDLAMTTPAAFAAAALDGRGPYRERSYPGLRALGVLPQRDRLVAGVSRSLEITSFAELRERRPALRVATAPHDGVNHVGWAAHELLTRSGVDIAGWGGSFVEGERPFDAFDAMNEGLADAIVQEAIMLPPWQKLATGLAFLPVEPDVLAGIEADLGWPPAVIPAGYLPGTPEFRTLDFSDFLLFGRDDLPDDLAYAVAWILGETRQVLERQYAHIPAERSPVTYPLEPLTMGRTPIPLHPGAARYYNALPR